MTCGHTANFIHRPVYGQRSKMEITLTVLMNADPWVGLTIRGPHTNVRRGPFLIRVARIFSGCTFPSKKVETFKRQNSVVKIWQLTDLRPRFSTILCKFANNFSFRCHPLEGVTRGGPPYWRHWSGGLMKSPEVLCFTSVLYFLTHNLESPNTA